MLEDNSLFTWKSRETMQQEEKEYEKWAFPYGLLQRQNLITLLLAVFPHESVFSTLVPFLTCRELYEKVLKNCGDRNTAIEKMLNEVKSYKNILKKNNMPLFLALVLANEEIDERSLYPSATAIKDSAAALKLLQL